MKRLSLFKLLMTAFTVGVAASPMIQANSQQPASQSALEEIIVTAQKREQALSDVPFSISAIGGEDLESKGVIDVQGLAREIPSVTINQGFSSTATVVSIRGIDAVSSGDPTTAFYLDDLAYGVPGFAFGPPLNLYDLERVEVLRGPQGTLYGASAMGGLIRLITADPDASAGFGGKVQTSYSSYTDGDNSLGGDIALNIPLIEDVLAARIVASYQDAGGYIDRPGNNDANDAEYQSYRAKLKYTPNDRLTAKLAVWHTEDDAPFGALVTNAEDRFNNGGLESTFTGEQTLSSFTLSYEFDNFTLEESLSYADYEQTQLFQSAGVFSRFNSFEAETLTQELRLISSNDGPWQWITGLFYRTGDMDLSTDINVSPFPAFLLDGLDGLEQVRIESEEIALFGELSYGFLDGDLEVLMGFRYSEEERDFFSGFESAAISFVDNSVGPTVVTPAVNTDDTFETFNPRFNITWRATEDALVYLNIAKGYRPGKVNSGSDAAIGAGAPFFVDVAAVNDDQIITYELGTKATLLDGDLAVEFSVYYNDWEDAQFPINLTAANTPVTNIGDMQLLGSDLSLTYQTPVEGLVASLVTSFNHGEWDQINDNQFTVIDGRYTEGRAISSIPDQMALFKLDYITAINDSLNLLAAGSYYYRDQQEDVWAAGSIAGAQQVVNLQLGVESPEDWNATLFVNNANNEDEVATFSLGLPTIIPPREIGLRLQKHF